MGYAAPGTLQEAFDLLTGDTSVVVAGGTDVYPSLGDRPVPDRLVDITRIDALQGISRSDFGWRIGAAASWSDVARNTTLPAVFDALKEAAIEVGSVQIQNAGTIAGNLCNASPAADGVPALLALGAEVELASRRGHRVVPLDRFLTGPRSTALQMDELMVCVHVPDFPPRSRSSFLKLGSRRYLVISIAMVAVVVWLDDDGRIEVARVAVGACSSIAVRLRLLEADLVGQHADALLTPGLVSPLHMTDLSPIDDIRADAEYRLDAAATLCQRALAAAVHKIGRAHG